jgi:inorganic triphosphatase YgiF
MGLEIELKLLIDEADLHRLFRHPFINRHVLGPVVKKHLINHYFDTPDQILRQNDMALRIRFDGRQYIQTLKKKGESRDGLAVRGEWEWVLEDSHIDIQRVPFDIWPPALRNCPERLTPIFRTDFHRTQLLLEISSGTGLHIDDPVRVEMSLDRGFVTTDIGKGTAGGDKILEVEFELLDGPPQALMEISRHLKGDIRLTPCDISKAERGYRRLSGVSQLDP